METVLFSSMKCTKSVAIQFNVLLCNYLWKGVFLEHNFSIAITKDKPSLIFGFTMELNTVKLIKIAKLKSGNNARFNAIVFEVD